MSYALSNVIKKKYKQNPNMVTTVLTMSTGLLAKDQLIVQFLFGII